MLTSMRPSKSRSHSSLTALRSNQTSLLGAVLLAVFLSIAAGVSVNNAMLFVSLAIGLTWLIVGLGTATTPQQRWSPLRTFLPALVAYSGASISMSSSTSKPLEILCTVLAVVGFAFGYALAMTGSKPRFNADQIQSERPRYWIVYVSFVVASAAYGMAAVQAGGLPAFSGDANFARTQFFPNGISSTLTTVGYSIVILTSMAYFLRRRAVPHMKLLLTLSLVSVLALAFLSNRGLLVGPSLIALILIFWTRRIPLVWFILLSAGGLFLFSYLGYQRNLEAYGSTYVDDIQLAGFTGIGQYLAPVLQYVAGTSQAFALTDRLIPAVIDFQHGHQFFGPLLGTESADLFLKDSAGLNFVGFGLALGFVNAFYMDWGILGTFVGPLLFGAFVALFYRKANFASVAWCLIIAQIAAKMLLSLYGHPFAYLSYVLTPVVLFFAAGGRILGSGSSSQIAYPPVGRTSALAEAKAEGK